MTARRIALLSVGAVLVAVAGAICWYITHVPDNETDD